MKRSKQRPRPQSAGGGGVVCSSTGLCARRGLPPIKRGDLQTSLLFNSVLGPSEGPLVAPFCDVRGVKIGAILHIENERLGLVRVS